MELWIYIKYVATTFRLTPCLLVVAGERALVEDGSVAADEGPVGRLQDDRLRLVQEG